MKRAPISNYVRPVLVWSGALAAGCGIMFAAYSAYERTPPNTFNPFCTYRLAYRLNVTLEVEGKHYTSSVVRQLAHSRRWIATINSGCRRTLGTAASFRLDDNRLVLIGTYICPKALEALAGTHQDYIADDFTGAMRERRKVNVTSLCMGVQENQPPHPTIGPPRDQGFVIDNSDNPSRWRGLAFKSDNVAGPFRIVSAVAEAQDTLPEDQLDTVAPTILKTTFKYRNWSDSPEPLFWVNSRYFPAKQFSHTAEEERP
jgi:hypothetical protein